MPQTMPGISIQLPDNHEKSLDKLSPTVSSISNESPKHIKKSEPNQRIKRPMNAFMVWSQIRRQEISANGGKFHNSDISKMLGAEWRKMAEADKLPFVQKARELREEHFREHPDYVYRPRRRKRNVKSVSAEPPVGAANEDTIIDNSSLMPSMLLNQLLYQHLISQMAPQPLINAVSAPNMVLSSNIATQSPLTL